SLFFSRGAGRPPLSRSSWSAKADHPRVAFFWPLQTRGSSAFAEDDDEWKALRRHPAGRIASRASLTGSFPRLASSISSETWRGECRDRIDLVFLIARSRMVGRPCSTQSFGFERSPIVG